MIEWESAHSYWKNFEVKIESFHELIEALNDVDRIQAKNSGHFVWRGQANAG